VLSSQRNQCACVCVHVSECVGVRDGCVSVCVCGCGRAWVGGWVREGTNKRYTKLVGVGERPRAIGRVRLQCSVHEVLHAPCDLRKHRTSEKLCACVYACACGLCVCAGLVAWPLSHHTKGRIHSDGHGARRSLSSNDMCVCVYVCVSGVRFPRERVCCLGL
jgi:hypothetical protein